MKRAALLIALTLIGGCVLHGQAESWRVRESGGISEWSYSRVTCDPIGRATCEACEYIYDARDADKNGRIRPRRYCVKVAGGAGSPGLWEFMGAVIGGIVGVVSAS